LTVVAVVRRGVHNVVVKTLARDTWRRVISEREWFEKTRKTATLCVSKWVSTVEAQRATVNCDGDVM